MTGSSGALDPSAAPPRVGLTTYREQSAWGVWNEPADLLPASYSDEIVAAGGVPLLLPPAASDHRRAAAVVLEGLHGVVLAGGADVDPLRYDAERHERTGPARPDRDEWEITLALMAIDLGLPLLAICRGMQVLNVALGGDLDQHLPDVVGHDEHCPVIGEHGRHSVRLAPGSRLGAALGGSAKVPTYHHQAVRNLGTGLQATGWAEDGTVEAVECAGPAFLVGVQWHPEVEDGAPLFAAFVTACLQYRERRVLS